MTYFANTLSKSPGADASSPEQTLKIGRVANGHGHWSRRASNRCATPALGGHCVEPRDDVGGQLQVRAGDVLT